MADSNPLLALTGNALPDAYELACDKCPKGASNGRHKSAWMSAVTDAVATGVPLFVPVAEASRADTNKTPLGQIAANVTRTGIESGEHQTLIGQHRQATSFATVWRQAVIITTKALINSFLPQYADLQRPQWGADVHS